MWIPLRIDFDLGSDTQSVPVDSRGHAPRLYQGADFDFSFQATIGDMPIDFSGRQWRFELYQGGVQTPFFVSTNAVTGDAFGKVSVRIPAATSQAWSLALNNAGIACSSVNCHYKLTSTDVHGTVERVAEGLFMIGLLV